MKFTDESKPVMKKDEELEKYIIERMNTIQTHFDTTKASLLTAGLLVAVGVVLPNLQTSTILGYSGIKVVMACTICSAISLVLSYAIAEHQAKRHDRLTGPKPIKKIEEILLGNITQRKAKLIAWYYGSFHNYLITITNNVSTFFLLAALVLFLYLLIE